MMAAVATTSHNPRAVIVLVAIALGGAILSGARSHQPAPGGAVKETIPGTVVSFEMVPVPAGTVMLDGSAAKVEAFLIGRTEVTWDMYDLFAVGQESGVDAASRPSQPYGAPDYNWGHAGFPVISVTRNAAEEFCKWLSAKTGKAYRLPTEAEWVRAATLGAAATADGREAMTWHAGNAKGTTHAVATRRPDGLGLFDLFGNTTEWVMTPGDDLVTRGGSFRDPLASTGPAARIPYDMSWQERDPQLPKSKWWLSDAPFVGFRLAASAK